MIKKGASGGHIRGFFAFSGVTPMTKGESAREGREEEGKAEDT
jgi:hypothetical protein